MDIRILTGRVIFGFLRAWVRSLMKTLNRIGPSNNPGERRLRCFCRRICNFRLPLHFHSPVGEARSEKKNDGCWKIELSSAK